MSKVHYGCTALIGTNKVGKLTPDADGRYMMVLGALEYPNSVGDIYTLASAKPFFEEGSNLMNKVRTGQLRAEYGHPKMRPGEDDRQYLERILSIEETMVCAHISDIYIDYTNVKDPKTGRTVIAIMGKVKPAGPYGQYLKEALDDPKQNVAFSVRSLTINRMVGMIQHKDFTTIVTWDYVNQPGLAPANKYSVPTLEMMSVFKELDIPLETIRKTAFNTGSRVSQESANLAREVYYNVKNSVRSFDW